MLKKILVVAALTCAALLSGCQFFVGDVDAMAPSGASAVFDDGSWTYYYGETQYYVVTQSPTVPSTTAPQTTYPNMQIPLTPVAPNGDAPAQTQAPEPTDPPATDPPAANEPTTAPAEVDLGIRMPTPNGVMVVSRSPENMLIKTVHERRGVGTAFLTAVYSEPKSGQNYVFEFYSASDHSAEQLRRVYYLTDDGVIVNVAADRAGEVENLDSVTNWFCMNVLIKGTIFPALKDQM